MNLFVFTTLYLLAIRNLFCFSTLHYIQQLPWTFFLQLFFVLESSKPRRSDLVNCVRQLHVLLSRECCGTWDVRLWCVYVYRCSYIMDKNGEPVPFRLQDQEAIVQGVIEPMASNGLRTISIAYKDFVAGNADIISDLFVFLYLTICQCWRA